MKQKSKIKVIKVVDVLNNEILQEFSQSESQKAYEYAAQLENYGLEVQVIAPTITETLADSLGMSANMQQEYAQSVIAELSEHDGCCAKQAD